MVEKLMYISNALIILSFALYFILIIINNKKITESNGFNITKDILNEYDSINIIESKNYFTVYNIKRKVIKIASKCYYGNTLSDIAIPLIESGVSVIDNKGNKSIDFLRKIIPSLKYLYIFPIFMIGVNSVTYNISDAKVSIVFGIVALMISYILVNIKSESVLLLSSKIKKIKGINNDNKNKIISFINKVIFFDKLIFMSEGIMIIRFVMLLVNM